jgi:hypothetical protein
MSLNVKWPGSGSAISGSTPYALYDADADFQTDGPRTAVWCATRLGYPTVDIEMIDTQFYACFEEAVSEYSAQVNQFNIRNNLNILRGYPKSENKNFSQTLVDGSFVPTIFRMSQAYGTLAYVGGDTDIKKAYIDMEVGKQEYDIASLAKDAATSQSFSTLFNTSSKFEITKVFFESTPAIQRFFDPYSVGAQGTLNLLDEFGFGQYSPAAQFLLMPLFEDALRIQHIELNDQIRKSAYTFNIVNDKIKVFPIPTVRTPKRIYFEYFSSNEFDKNAITIKDNKVSDYSDIKYDFISYDSINDVGKQWIRKYTLALAKELLGAIREKYSTIPIPDGEVSLDGAALRSEAQTEKDTLITQLRENLDELGRTKQFEYKKNEADYHQEMLKKIPLTIYIG